MAGPPLEGIGELIADEPAIFIVIVRGHHMDITRCSRQGTRRYSTFGEEETFIPSVDGRGVAVHANDFTTVDGDIEVQLCGIDADSPLG